MARPYDIVRNPQPDGVDYLLLPRDDGEIPLRAEKLIWGTGALILLAMSGSAVAVGTNALHRFGWVTGTPWVGGLLIVATLLAALVLQAWVFTLDDGEVRVALRHHHLTVNAESLPLVDILAVEEQAGEIRLVLAERSVVLPVSREDLLSELRRAVEGAQPSAPPESLRRLRERA